MKSNGKTNKLSLEAKEDIALGNAIQEDIKSGFVSEKEVMKMLRKLKRK
jgi:hypothetical protein